jgi:hypothetical protein
VVSEAANRIRRGADGALQRWDGCAVFLCGAALAHGEIEPTTDYARIK